MPTYDYECDACGHTFELFQAITEGVKKKCPECKNSNCDDSLVPGLLLFLKALGFTRRTIVASPIKRVLPQPRRTKKQNRAMAKNLQKKSTGKKSGPAGGKDTG